MTVRSLFVWLFLGLFSGASLAVPGLGAQADWDHGAALQAACALDPDRPRALRTLSEGSRLIEARLTRVRDQTGRSLHRLLLADGAEILIRRVSLAGRLRRVTVERFEPGSDGPRPLVSVSGGINAGGECRAREVRRLVYDGGGAASALEILDPETSAVTSTELLNPPVPRAEGPDAGQEGVAVALVDTGVNYTLPQVAGRLARDQAGQALGFDYWDWDERPFDVDTARSPFFPLRHGTAVASIVLREAPAARIVPYRFPRPDMRRFQALVSDLDGKGVEIVSMALGSNSRADWAAFEAEARARPHVLFVVSAGNDGRNIDREPVYPAALDLDNILTVTSSDAFGRLAQGSNWGPIAVDVMTPGEQIEVIDHRGVAGRASGSSFAVPRIVALAARLKAKNPEWRAGELKRAIVDRARPAGSGGGFGRTQQGPSPVRHGWIPDPLDDFAGPGFGAGRP